MRSIYILILLIWTIPAIDVEAQTDYLNGITASKKDKIVLLNQLVTNCYSVIDSLNQVLSIERTENAKSLLRQEQVIEEQAIEMASIESLRSEMDRKLQVQEILLDSIRQVLNTYSDQYSCIVTETMMYVGKKGSAHPPDIYFSGQITFGSPDEWGDWAPRWSLDYTRRLDFSRSDYFDESTLRYGEWYVVTYRLCDRQSDWGIYTTGVLLDARKATTKEIPSE